MTEKKRASPVGCLILLLVIVPPFFLVPTGVAVGFAVVCVLYLFIVPEINREIQRIGKRMATNKSTIAAAREGFVELMAPIKHEESLTSWLEDEQIDFGELTFHKMQRYKSQKSQKVILYHYRTSPRVVRVSDGSGDCWVSLHNATLHLRKKQKRLKREQMLEMLREKPLPDFPFDGLDEETTFWVDEYTVPARQPVYLYGHLSKVANGALPEIIITQQNTKKAHRYEEQFRMSDEDWENIVASTDSSQIKLLTSDYSPETYIERLIISLKGDSNLRMRSYLTIVMMILMLLVTLGFYGVYVWKGHPDFYQQVVAWIEGLG